MNVEAHDAINVVFYSFRSLASATTTQLLSLLFFFVKFFCLNFPSSLIRRFFRVYVCMLAKEWNNERMTHLYHGSEHE